MSYFKFRDARRKLAQAGFEILDAKYDYWAFGNWFVEVRSVELPAQRLVWDGRDQALIVEFFGSRDQWWNKVIFLKPAEQTIDCALAALLKPLTNELQSDREREQDKYWEACLRDGSVLTE